ncbi:hypothetical protein SLEP1_g21355 [Rubroshorea leprosula]|uniref:Uncharacterized protein n=1 Tax=Rubroshorea leprosula TaxID=152421 RepID=A0AAV5JEX8_9ROSI|nr:hypothetical protein SLEP1_g21355 [Rubroshorea leprosula]
MFGLKDSGKVQERGGMSLRCEISPVSLKPISKASTQLVPKIFSAQLPDLVRFLGAVPVHACSCGYLGGLFL